MSGHKVREIHAYPCAVCVQTRAKVIHDFRVAFNGDDAIVDGERFDEWAEAYMLSTSRQCDGAIKAADGLLWFRLARVPHSDRAFKRRDTDAAYRNVVRVRNARCVAPRGIWRVIDHDVPVLQGKVQVFVDNRV